MYECDLRTLRYRLDVTQAQMAQAMGLPLRTYEDLEGGRSVVRPVHWRASYMAAITLAYDLGKPEALPPDLADLVRSTAAKFDRA